MARSRTGISVRFQVAGIALLFGVLLLACDRRSLSGAQTPLAHAAAPSSAATLSTPGQTATAAVRQGGLVGAGYRTLLAGLVVPTSSASLLSGAWAGVVAEARRQGVEAHPDRLRLGDDADQNLAAFQQAYASLLGKTLGTLDEGKLERAALTSMAQSAHDCHTAYLTRDQWSSINQELRGSEALAGLPLSFHLSAPFLIQSVVAGSNADRQGIRPGDRVLRFDGEPIDAIPLSQRKFLSAGSEGSAAAIDVETAAGGRRSLTVRRELVERPVVNTRLIGDVAYIRLRTFTFNLSATLDPAIAALQAQGARGFVLDLRGNLGGELNADVHLLSHFIPSGVLAVTSERDASPQEIRTDGSTLAGPPPLAVLVDGGSLSASELFAEDIRQFGAGSIVGSPTPGCLLGSTFRTLPDGSAMQVSALKVQVGPQATIVNDIGVQPDLLVPLTASDLASGNDPQLQRALARVRERLGASSSIQGRMLSSLSKSDRHAKRIANLATITLRASTRRPTVC